MKKILSLVLVLSIFAALAACTQVTRISIDNPVEIKLEKAGGGMTINLTDAKTVKRLTDVVCQIPLQDAEESADPWTYRLTWLDADGSKITTVTLAGSQIRWEGRGYSMGIGVDLSVITNVLETVPGLNP